MRKHDEIRLRHMVEAAREAVSFSGESEALEFKSTTGARREAAMTVCAFLNRGLLRSWDMLALIMS